MSFRKVDVDDEIDEDSEYDDNAIPSQTYELNDEVIAGRLRHLYPHVDPQTMPLPMSWNSEDCHDFIKISTNNLRARYPDREPDDDPQQRAAKLPGSVRANCKIPLFCGIYYFEVHVVKSDGYMGVGVCLKGVSLGRLPGWDRHSYGYHGDDGNFFSASGTGTNYGPTFSSTDVIGCGVNLIRRTIFFTKNGLNLGNATTLVESLDDLYPTVGLQTAGSVVDVNFGQKPFVYDIFRDIQSLRENVKFSVKGVSLPLHSREMLNELVAHWLSVEGHANALECMEREAGVAVEEELSSVKRRQEIARLIVAKKATKAYAYMTEYYKGITAKFPLLELDFRAQMFVEKALDYAHPRSVSSSKNGCSSGGRTSKNGCSAPSPIQSPIRSSPCVSSSATDDAHLSSPPTSTRAQKRRSSSGSTGEAESHGVRQSRLSAALAAAAGDVQQGRRRSARMRQQRRAHHGGMEMDDAEASSSTAPPPMQSSSESSSSSSSVSSSRDHIPHSSLLMEHSQAPPSSSKNGAAKNGRAASNSSRRGVVVESATTIVHEEPEDLMISNDHEEDDRLRAGYTKAEEQRARRLDPLIVEGCRLNEQISSIDKDKPVRGIPTTAAAIIQTAREALLCAGSPSKEELELCPLLGEERLRALARHAHHSILLYLGRPSESRLMKLDRLARENKEELLNRLHPSAPFIAYEEVVLGRPSTINVMREKAHKKAKTKPTVDRSLQREREIMKRKMEDEDLVDMEDEEEEEEYEDAEEGDEEEEEERMGEGL